MIKSLEQKLNFDILFDVMDYLNSPSDVLSLMKTCKVLHNAGIPHLLALPLSFTGNIKRRNSLFTYITRYPSRLKYIKHFKLRQDIGSLNSYPSRDFHSRRILKTILESSTQLETLAISSWAWDEILLNDSGIFPETISFPKLTRLTVYPVVTEGCVTMLKGLNAPLRRIRLDFERTRDHSIKFMDPFPVLNNFRHTLVKVCMVGFEWDRTAMIPDATFPNVRFLSIRTGSYQTVHIVALMVAFPNVRVFHISNFYGALEDDELEIVREMNIDDQGTINQCWEHLDVVKGDPCSLYEMGLKMKVSKVRLLLIIPKEYKCCHRLLVDTKPRHLQIRWPQESSHSDFADPREEVLGMFTFEGLDFLSIHFNFFRKTLEDINRFMDAFLKLLRSSKLRYLHIKIVFESVYSHNFEPQPQLQPVGDMENELKAWRGKAIDEISSLQMIIFQIKQQSEKFEAWRTTNLREPGETCSLEKVTKNECKRLIGKEGYRVEKWRYNRIDLSLDPES